jgi:glycolate oxidase
MVTPEFLSEMQSIVGAAGVIAHPTELSVYDCDGYTLEKSIPDVVLLPRSTNEVSTVLRLLKNHEIPFVPRGTGTGLSGGCLPLGAPVMIGLSRMNQILSLDPANRRAVVQSGVINLWVSRAAHPHGLYYVPDPSSQMACSIGGNIAENSGGPHTLKYGVTTNHVLGVTMVLPDGEIVRLGGMTEDPPGYDLLGISIGSEGTFGIVTEAILRLRPMPEAYKTLLAVFDSVDAGSRAVAGIVASGILPAALEMMDALIIQAVEAAFHFGFPLDAGAVLIVEVDGVAEGLDGVAEKIATVCRRNDAREVRLAKDEAEREALWKCRKRAFGAVGRLAPNYCCQDGVVPPDQLPEMMRRIAEIATRYALRIGNVFHAGDGNIHPILLYDERDTDQTQRVVRAGQAILQECVSLGGTLTGEHGIGVEKVDLMPLIFTADDLRLMEDIRAVFDPDNCCNPNKIFPSAGERVSVAKPRRQAAL